MVVPGSNYDSCRVVATVSRTDESGSASRLLRL